MGGRGERQGVLVWCTGRRGATGVWAGWQGSGRGCGLAGRGCEVGGGGEGGLYTREERVGLTGVGACTVVE